MSEERTPEQLADATGASMRGHIKAMAGVAALGKCMAALVLVLDAAKVIEAQQVLDSFLRVSNAIQLDPEDFDRSRAEGVATVERICGLIASVPGVTRPSA